YRYATWADEAVKARRALAREWTTDTLLVSESDAQELADADGAFHGADIRPYRFRALGVQFRVRAGSTITVQHPRLFPAGRDLFVSSVTEVVADGQRYTEITGWG